MQQGGRVNVKKKHVYHREKQKEESREGRQLRSHGNTKSWADGRSKAHVAAGTVPKGGKPAEQSCVSTFLSRKTWSKSEDTC